MLYLAIGVLGFIIIHLSDPAAIKRLPAAKPVAWVVGGGLLAYSIVEACLWPEKLSLPVWSTWSGWALLAVSSAMVAYSLFINLPFFETYVATGVGDRLVTSGFYALVRHPGVLWTVLVAFSIVLVSRSRSALVAAPVFILLDVLAVTIQDKFFFRRMFAGYDRYQRETPMLIPTRESMKAFVRSLRQPRGAGATQPDHEAKEANNVHVS